MIKGRPLPTFIAVLLWVLPFLCAASLLLTSHAGNAASLDHTTALQPRALLLTSLTNTDTVTVSVGAEITGIAGPIPVNCSDPIYVAARSALDQQRADWLRTATAMLPGATAMTSLLAGPSGATVNAPLLLTQPDGFQLTITPVDLAPTWGLQSASPATGIPAFDSVQINGSPTGCTMQDNAPRPSSAMGGDYYVNQLHNGRGLNGLLFTFSTPVQAFGAFFGDLETSDRGTTAFLRLFDREGNRVTDWPLRSTLGLAGGIAAENALCDQRSAPNAQVAAQGLAPGCGNGSTRWVGFVSATPIAQALVVVGDNDPLPGGQGLSEKLSVMAPTLLRTLPPAEVAITKSAPTMVTVGTPFPYTITIANLGATLAAGIVITDIAPASLRFHSVIGPGCTVTATLLTCAFDALAPGASATLLLQATTTTTMPLTNTVSMTAVNDTDWRNNRASATIMPVAAPSRTACTAPILAGGPPLVINEVLYNEVGSSGDEWVELYATTNLPAGAVFFLSDNESSSGAFNRVITIPAGGIAAGVYLVVHDDSNPAGDDLDAADGLLEFWGAGSTPGGTSLRNTGGDNLTLYRGATAVEAQALDYMRYDNDAILDGTTDPAPGPVSWSDFAADNASDGQSLVLLRNGVDGRSAGDWTLAGANGTQGKATLGTNNNGLLSCNVAIQKSGPLTGVVGASFAYTIAVYNTAPITMTGVVVTDTQPAGLRFTAVTGTGCNLIAGSLACAVGLLPPLGQTVITVTATANQAAVITNTAYIRAISDTIATDNVASHAMTVQALGAIGDFVYLDANQNGVQDPDEQTPLNGVVVTLQSAAGWVAATQTVDGLYLFPYLPAGLYTVTIGSAAGHELTSAGSYAIMLAAGQLYHTADFGFAYAPATVAVTKSGATTAIVGEPVVYTLTVHNHSTTTPALAIVLTDTLPAGLANAQVTDIRCAIIVAELYCNLGTLAPQTATTITMTTTAAMAGSWVNRVVIAAENDAHLTDHVASLTTVLLAPTAIPTITSSPTDTELPTSTATATPTPVPPTATSTATMTEIPTMTATDTVTPTPTATPTVTATDMPTPTVTPTSTATLELSTATATVLPTATPTPTASDTATPTATVTSTTTPEPPTATSTASPTEPPTVTATDTLIPTPTATNTPTESVTMTATSSTTTPPTPATPTAVVTATETEIPTATATTAELDTPTSTPTWTTTPTATATPTPTLTVTSTTTPVPPTVTATATATIVPTPTATTTATSTVTDAPTVTPTATGTMTPIPIDTATPTITTTPTDTLTPTPTVANIATSTYTATPWLSPTALSTPTATLPPMWTPMPTPSPTPSLTDTPSATPLVTATIRPTALATASHTAMPTATLTPTQIPTVTATASATPSPTATNRPTASATPSVTATPTATPIPSTTPTAIPTPMPLPTVATTSTATVTPVVTPRTERLADLVLRKEAQALTVEPGGLITYTLRYGNVGLGDAEAVVITETIPAHTTVLLDQSTPGWHCPHGITAGASCTFALPQLRAQQQGEIRYVVRVEVNLPVGLQIDNEAAIGAVTGELKP